jgi:hypothetical protein
VRRLRAHGRVNDSDAAAIGGKRIVLRFFQPLFPNVTYLTLGPGVRRRSDSAQDIYISVHPPPTRQV